MEMTEREFEAAVVKAAIEIASSEVGKLEVMKISSLAGRLVAAAVAEARRNCPHRIVEQIPDGQRNA